jgi:hypothetical protein
MSFRQFGGINRAATNNIVRNQYSASDKPTIPNTLGQANSKIVSESHIDLSGNSLLNTQTVYFTNGTSINNGDPNDMTIDGNLLVTGNFTVDGTITTSTITTTSDYRFKGDVNQLDDQFSVDQLKPVTYTNKLLGKQDIGFLAHEVQEVFPYLVNGVKDGPETQSLNYNGLIGVLVKEIQDLKKRIAVLEKNENL